MDVVSAADCGVAEPCDRFMDCRRSAHNIGAGLSKCWQCRFAKANGGTMNMYLPGAMSPKVHPAAAAEKRQRSITRRQANQAKRLGKSKSKQRILKRAEQAERGTEKEIIWATVNSGRRDQNLDHISRDRILLDSKYQSTRDNPVVKCDEMDKARRQAEAAGYPVGGLVLINRCGRRFVVFDILDYPKVVR